MRPALRRLALAVLATVFVAGGLTVSDASAATPYRRDLYFRAGYERQIDSRTCVAAGTAMMLNFIARRDLGLSQMGILRYAQPRDALNDNVQRGSDPLGWSRALTHFSERTGKRTVYEWAAYTSKGGALRVAARAIARYGKPVGLLVWSGRHAVVMTGFESTRDPRKGDFTLTRIITSDPYWAGETVGKHRGWSVEAFPLRKYTQLDATRTYDRLWYGKYIVVIPTN